MLLDVILQKITVLNNQSLSIILFVLSLGQSNLLHSLKSEDSKQIFSRKKINYLNSPQKKSKSHSLMLW